MEKLFGADETYAPNPNPLPDLGEGTDALRGLLVSLEV